MPIATYILTGFLGAGKTTFLNRVLQAPSMGKTAVVINEFGEIGLDHLLVESTSDTILELSNGCLCCSIRGELVDTLSLLADRDIERVIIETTGVADPAPIAQVVLGHPILSKQFDLKAIVSIVDLLSPKSGGSVDDAYERQIALADRIVISKSDLVEGSQRDQLLAQCAASISKLNQIGEISVLSELTDPANIFRCNNVPSSAVVHRVSQFDVSGGHKHGHVVNHASVYQSTILQHTNPIPRHVLDTFMEQAILRFGDQLLRIKGLVLMVEHPDKPLVVHGVQNVFHEPQTLESWPNEKRETNLVVITRELDPRLVRSLFLSFVGEPQIDTPDLMASYFNPLAIPGM